MPRGGYRPGAGRPKGGGGGKVKPAPAVKAPKLPGSTMKEAKTLPLAYMLEVMNDPEADAARRDRMAIAAAPFMHNRVEFMKNRGDLEPQGKKAEANVAAVTAQVGTDWENLLTGQPVQ